MRTLLGFKIKGIIDAGELVPDDMLYKVLADRLNQDDCKNGFILDGLPRTFEQAIWLDEQFLGPSIAIEVTVPEEEIYKRVTGRRSCKDKDCGEIFNIYTRKPKQENICDKCGSELIWRKDDQNEEAVQKRIDTYHEKSDAITQHYKDQGTYYEVENIDVDKAVKDIEKITGLSSILKFIGKAEDSVMRTLNDLLIKPKGRIR